MKRSFRLPKFGRWPKSKKEEQEFGPGKKDFVACPDCDAVYYDKSWKHGFEGGLKQENDTEKSISFKVCPADAMRRDGVFEGELTLVGIPAGEKEGILNRVRNMGEKAQASDPLDRILSLEEKGGTVRITTSENQLALQMGKAVQKASKASSIESTFSRAESPTRVTVSWKKE